MHTCRSLVIETIPKHAQYPGKEVQPYKRYHDVRGAGWGTLEVREQLACVQSEGRGLQRVCTHAYAPTYESREACADQQLQQWLLHLWCLRHHRPECTQALILSTPPECPYQTQQVFEVMKELEQLRVALTMHNVQQPTARTLNRPSDAAQLVTSNLPEIDWGSVGASTNGAVVATGNSAFGAEAADWLARVSSGAAAGSSGAGAGAGAVVSVASGSFSSSGGSFSGASGSYQSAYVPSSQHSLDKHALFAAKTLSGRTAVGPAAQAPRPRYPGFDATPAAAIDLLWLPQKQQQQQPQDGSPSAPPEAALARLELAERRSSGAAAGSLLDAPMAPHPSAGPSLGPQEVPVHSMDASSAHPGGTCAQAAVPPAGQLSVVEPGGGAGGLKPLEKRLEMRDVHVSVALMNDFLHYASTNTSRCANGRLYNQTGRLGGWAVLAPALGLAAVRCAMLMGSEFALEPSFVYLLYIPR